MYGSGSAKLPNEKSGKEASHGEHSASSGKEGATTQFPGTATSNPTPPARPQAQYDASTASIKSGVLGSGLEESQLTSETANTSHTADASKDPITYPTGTESNDYSDQAERRVDPELSSKRGEETAAVGQTSTYRSSSFAKGDKTSHVIDREPSRLITQRQAQNINSPASATGAGYTGSSYTEENTSAPDRAFTGAAGVTAREGTRVVGSRESIPAQNPKAESNNPYSASRLDPRVDPHAKPSSIAKASAAGAFVTSAKEPAGDVGGYASSTDNRGLSSAKTTAEPFDGPKGTSQPLQGPKGTAEPFDDVQETPQRSQTKGAEPLDGLKDASWSLKDEDQCQTLVGAMPGAFEYGTDTVESSYHDPVPQDKASYYDFGSSITGGSTTDPTQGPKGTAESSDDLEAPSWPLKDQDQHQASAGTMPEGLGHQDNTVETRSHDVPQTEAVPDKFGSSQPVQQKESRTSNVGKSPGAGGASEPNQTVYSGTGTSDTNIPMDESHKGRNAGVIGAVVGALGLGGYAAKKHAEDRPERPTAGSRRESIPTTTYPPGTGLDDRRYPEAPVGGLGAASSRGQDLGAAPFTEARSQPSTTRNAPGTGLADRPYPQEHEGVFAATRSGAQDSKAAPSTGASSQPSTTPYVTKTEPTAATGSMRGPSTSTPASTAVDRSEESHIGRNTANGGATAAGTGAIGAHEHTKHRAEKSSTATSDYIARDKSEESYTGRNTAIGGAPAAGAGAVGAHEYPQPQAERPSTGMPNSNANAKPENGQFSSNMAIGGAAAVGAGAIGAQEYSLHQAEKETQERLEAGKAHQKAMDESRRAAEKEQKAHEKALATEEKKAEKEHEKAMHKEEKKAEKDHEKAVKKEEKEYEKEHMMAMKTADKRQKEHEKELAKQEKEAEKEAEKRRGSDEKDKKKHGLLGLFHRRRDSKGSEVGCDEDDHTGVKTAAGVEVAGAAGAGAQEHEKRHVLGLPHHEVKNKLHKDPPPGLYSGDSATPAYADYAVKENDHPGAQTAMGGYTAPAPDHDEEKYAGVAGAGASGTYTMADRPRGGRDADALPGAYRDAPTKGYASQVTGGTGTTALAHGDRGSGADDAAYQAMGGSRTTASAKGDQGFNGSHTGGTTTSPPGTTDMTGERGEGISATNRPRAPSGVTYGDLPHGYASQVTGDTGTTALAEGGSKGKDISLHSDGRRYYADGRPVDEAEESENVKHRSEGGTVGKVLEKLHLRKGSSTSASAGSPGVSEQQQEGRRAL